MVDFLILGPANGFKYSNVFPLMKERKMWFGTTKFGQHIWFYPDDNYVLEKSFKKDKDGRMIVDVNGCGWFTNIEHNVDKHLTLTKKYDPDLYKKFDGTDIINVDSIYDIPYDYTGAMGVPINYIDKWDPEEFELIGAAGCGGVYNMFTPRVEGKNIYARLIIRKT